MQRYQGDAYDREAWGTFRRYEAAVETALELLERLRVVAGYARELEAELGRAPRDLGPIPQEGPGYRETARALRETTWGHKGQLLQAMLRDRAGLELPRDVGLVRFVRDESELPVVAWDEGGDSLRALVGDGASRLVPGPSYAPHPSPQGETPCPRSS